jgi:hypothetical protein
MAKNVGFITRKSVMMDGLEEADHVLGCSWRVDKAKEFGYWACRIANCMKLIFTIDLKLVMKTLCRYII